MRVQRSRGVAVLALLGAALLGGAAASAAAPAGDPLVVRQAGALLHDPRTQVLGNPRGDVTIVEFFDYACPTCKATEPRIEALLRADHGVRIIAKEYPVLSPQSPLASRAALAAARQGKYIAYHQAMLSYHGPLDEAVIFGIAHDVGLDVARLRRDMAAPEISQEIDANLALGRAIHAPGTPTFVVAGRILTQPSSRIDFPALVASVRRGQG